MTTQEWKMSNTFWVDGLLYAERIYLLFQYLDSLDELHLCRIQLIANFPEGNAILTYSKKNVSLVFY